MTFTELVSSMSRSGEIRSGEAQSETTYTVTISEDWMQGRTTYGGLSAALCLQAVLNEHANLPPLRSAQINFIGPAGGTVSITTRIMRQGKSVAYISAEMVGDKGIATHAVFCFGASRESKLNRDFTEKPSVPNIEESSDFFKLGPGPVFTSHFDCLLSVGEPPMSGTDLTEFFIWCRHRDQAANGVVALLSIADMPPPAVLPMFTEFAPISSMTWMMNFVKEDLSTTDGWYLLRSAAENSQNGYSSQDMQVWNSDRELLITGRQSVAIFY